MKGKILGYHTAMAYSFNVNSSLDNKTELCINIISIKYI